MKETILDQFEKPRTKEYYEKSKNNLKYSMILVIVSIIIISFVPKTGTLIEIISMIVGLATIIAVVISSMGIINGVKSYLRKEPSSPNRFLVLIGNFLIVGSFVLMIIMNLIDLMKFLNE